MRGRLSYHDSTDFFYLLKNDLVFKVFDDLSKMDLYFHSLGNLA